MCLWIFFNNMFDKIWKKFFLTLISQRKYRCSGYTQKTAIPVFTIKTSTRFFDCLSIADFNHFLPFIHKNKLIFVSKQLKKM